MNAWVSACRPRTLPAAIAPVAVGTACAAIDGGARPGIAAAALAGAVLIQIGTNLINDAGDFLRGADAVRTGEPRACAARGGAAPSRRNAPPPTEFLPGAAGATAITAKAPMPPVDTPPTASATPSAAKPALNENLLMTAHRSGHYKHLMAAVKATGLAETLDGQGPYTVFAPNDRAFDKLAKNELADLLKRESKARLTAILKLHVVAGHVRSGASGNQPALLQSLQGEQLAFDTAQGLRVNKARVVERDIEASNGVIHAIDTVLMPATR